jgi:hypothetical protein
MFIDIHMEGNRTRHHQITDDEWHGSLKEIKYLCGSPNYLRTSLTFSTTVVPAAHINTYLPKVAEAK